MEQVLVVPTALLRPYLRERGLIRGCEHEIYALTESEHLFLPRPQAEEDERYKQIIPYIMLLRGDEVFATRRLRAGGERRLHGLLSLGLGGHINRGDEESRMGTFARGLHRELEEEAAFTAASLEPNGIINDDTTAVGRVHLGFLFTLEVTEASVRETEKLEGLWLRRAELPACAGQMETWSQIALEALQLPVPEVV